MNKISNVNMGRVPGRIGEQLPSDRLGVPRLLFRGLLLRPLWATQICIQPLNLPLPPQKLLKESAY